MKKYMELEDAVDAAARQNFDRDCTIGLERARDWVRLRPLYEEEALTLLVETGENYVPDYEGQPHICLAQ